FGCEVAQEISENGLDDRQAFGLVMLQEDRQTARTDGVGAHFDNHAAPSFASRRARSDVNQGVILPPTALPSSSPASSAAFISPSTDRPVSYPLCSSISVRSSVARLPDAPGANGHPPRPPMEADRKSTRLNSSHV